MGERGVLVLFLFMFVTMFFISGVLADEDDLDFIDENAELEETEGITPDSAFYFVDDFFDRFADEVRVREEKVAEIKAMIEEGNFEAARKALERYRKHAENLEREISPDQRAEARRSAAAIYNVLKSLESQIPESDRREFVDDIIEREGRIVTAVEIANKIKKLCEDLSELDPLQYSRVCKTSDDSPDWQQRLDRDLTEEQKKEAKEFFDIMLQCFETSGGTCRCEDISVTPFANKCSQIAPLAFACDVEGDEAACDKMDEIEDEEPIEDLLPDYLKDVLRSIEDRFEDEQFDNHAPRECREVGATTKEECMNVMFRLDAPPECVEALERGDISLDNEREARESCEAIMFDLDAPFECKDAGLTDFRECGKLMFRLNAPQECLDAGLTGEHRSDERKCKEIAGGFDDHGGPNSGPGFGFNCQEIQNPEERLACYDGASSQVDSSHGGFDDENYNGPCFTNNDWENKKRECRNLYGEHAGDEPIYGNSGEGYECVIDVTCVDFGQYKEDDNPWQGCEALYCGPGAYCEYGQCIPFEDYVEPGEGEGVQCDDCASKCEDIPGQRLSGTACGDSGCECFYESIEEPVTEEPPVDEPTPEPEPEPAPADTIGTGAVISDRAFYPYYDR